MIKKTSIVLHKTANLHRYWDFAFADILRLQLLKKPNLNFR